MSIDITALAAELANDPLDVGYSGMTDAQCAIALNTVDRNVVVQRDSRKLLQWLAGSGRYQRIEDAAANPVKSDAIRSICKAALRMVERDGTLLDLSNAEQEGMIDALVADGTLTATDKSDLVTMATTQMSRSEELGLGGAVKPGNVAEARA